MFKDKAHIGSPYDEFLIYERTGEILLNKALYKLDGVISDNEFYFYYLDYDYENYDYEKEDYVEITNYCVFLFTNNALMMTPYDISIEPDFSPPIISRNQKEAYSNYIYYKDSMLTLFTLVDNKVLLNREKITENIYGTFESEDKKLSITLSKIIGDEHNYNFTTSSKELNKEIEEHIMMEKDINEKGELSDYWSPEHEPYVNISKIFDDIHGNVVIVFSYGFSTSYSLYISVINKDTLILLESCSPHMKKYGFNGIFKRKK